MRILLSVVLLWLFVPDWSGAAKLPDWGAHPRILARRVALGPELAKGARVGRLTWLGGVELDSDDPGFGGYSSLALIGGRFTLLSDGGNWLGFDLDERGRLGRIVTGTLPGGPDTGWRKEDRDSESLARDPATGRIWVGFEKWNAIWRYSPGFGRAERAATPDAMLRWPENGGPETLVRLRDGTFLSIAETAHWPGRHGRAGIVFSGDPTEHPNQGFRFAYRPPRGYNPSDAAELPDGRIVVLNRKFSLPYDFTAKLTLIDRGAIRPGATVRGREIATLAAPMLHDNFEGVAATRERGATILWLVSDDNQSLLQHTYLLKFRLDA